jgi:3-dehydroquinate synthetase
VDLIEEHEALLRSAGLPLEAQASETSVVISAMSRDKKRRQGDDSYRFVLLEAVGSPVRDVPVGEDEVCRAIESVTG